MIKGNIIRAV